MSSHPEEYNRQLFEQCPVGLVLYQPNGKLVDVNPAFATMLGYTPADMLHMAYQHISPSTYIEADAARLTELRQHGCHKPLEKEYIHSDGHLVPVRVSGRLIDKEGQSLVWSSVEDISDLKRAQQERQRTEQSLKQSEARYRSLVTGTTQIVWVSTPQGICFELTDWMAYTGQTLAEAENGGWIDAVHPEDRDRTAEVWGHAVATCSKYHIEYRIRGRDGVYRYFWVCGAPVLEDDGTVREWIGTCTDIHDRKLAEAENQRLQERYSSLVTATTQIVWGATPEGLGIGSQMLTWIEYTGQTLEEVEGWGWLDPIHPDDRPHSAAVWHQAVANRSLYETEYRLRGKDGVYRYFSVYGVPVVEADGSIREWVGTCTNIHDRKLAEAENQQLLDMLNHSSDAIIVRDMTDTISYWNQGAERLYGWTRDDVKDQSIHSLLKTQFAESAATALNTLLQHGSWEGELQHATRDGKPITVQSRWTLRRDASGTPCAVLEINTDITARKQAEVALLRLNQELEARVAERTAALQNTLAEAQGLNAILDNLADGLLVTTNDGNISHFNPAFLRMYGLATADLKGYPCRDLPMGSLADLLERAQANPKEVLSAEVDLAKDRIGQAIATAIFRQTLSDRPTDCFGAALLIRDVTVEKEIDKMKTDFISTVSHELRTPLTSVLGFASIIKEKLETDVFPRIAAEDRKLQKTIKRVDDNLNIIVTEAERLTSLINDVLDIAKMEAGKVEWQMQPLDVAELVDWAMNSTAALFTTRELKFRLELEPNLPQVVGDRNRLLQVLINLISNAVKFTEVGSVTCRAQQTHDGIRFSITDTGIGIAAEDQPKVFEKFRQVGDTLTDKPKGTGLGLPICKQIVEHHGGRIWVESNPGQGSTFSFVVPLYEGSSAANSHVNLEALVRQLREHVITNKTVPSELRKTILVVDDDVHIRELLRQQLETEGYQVREAKDGMDAIQHIKMARPDLIVLDVMMPQISGFDVAAVLKNDPHTANIPIIILSIIEDKERGFHIGIDRYLTKPINTEQLLSEIGSLLSQGSSSKKVLVVDQNASTLKTLSDVLQIQGYSVIEASNPQECIHKAIAAKPDMIIIDSMLSQEADLVKTLRFEKDLEHVVFIMLSDRE